MRRGPESSSGAGDIAPEFWAPEGEVQSSGACIAPELRAPELPDTTETEKRIKCPACVATYVGNRGLKKHTIIVHRRKYDPRGHKLVSFQSEEELEEAIIRCRRGQCRSATQRRKFDAQLAQGTCAPTTCSTTTPGEPPPVMSPAQTSEAAADEPSTSGLWT